MKWAIAGACPHCGGPIWVDAMQAKEDDEFPPNTYHSCGCGIIIREIMESSIIEDDSGDWKNNRGIYRDDNPSLN